MQLIILLTRDFLFKKNIKKILTESVHLHIVDFILQMVKWAGSVTFSVRCKFKLVFGKLRT